MYKIGVFKNGQHFAKSVFESQNLIAVENEFKRLWLATDFDPDGADNEADNADRAWYYKRFTEDTNNTAVFECENENDPLITNYTLAGMRSNML